MQRQEINFALEFFMVVAILSVLTAVALPHVNKFIGQGRAESYGAEFRSVETAVAAMLGDSDTGSLNPVGPTIDMNMVRTTDMPPLVLSDYLTGLDGTLIKSGCKYEFMANGTVNQIQY
jgi:hypothetical protein